MLSMDLVGGMMMMLVGINLPLEDDHCYGRASKGKRLASHHAGSKASLSASKNRPYETGTMR